MQKLLGPSRRVQDRAHVSLPHTLAYGLTMPSGEMGIFIAPEQFSCLKAKLVVSSAATCLDKRNRTEVCLCGLRLKAQAIYRHIASTTCPLCGGLTAKT